MMERRGRSADSRFFFGYHSGILGTPKGGMPREARFLTICGTNYCTSRKMHRNRTLKLIINVEDRSDLKL